jgi:hypothetical protein
VHLDDKIWIAASQTKEEHLKNIENKQLSTETISK